MSAPARLDPYFTQARPDACDLVVGRGLRVLDLGCSGGFLGAELIRRGTASVVHGVEADPDASRAASTRIDRVWTADLDGGLPALEPPYDVLVAADVLEHLRDPWTTLGAAVALVRPGGYVVASVPNIRYARVVGPLLLQGRFDYQDFGVLDRTHLRFFTRRSFVALLEGAGLVVETMSASPMAWRRGWKRVLGRALGDLGAEQLVARAWVTG